RILARSHHASGFRVGRSSSLSRLLYSSPRGGGGGAEGSARPVSGSKVISMGPHGERGDDLVDGGLVRLVAGRRTTHHQKVQEGGRRVDQGNLADPHYLIARRDREVPFERDVEDHPDAVVPAGFDDLFVGQDVGGVVLQQLIDGVDGIPQARDGELLVAGRAQALHFGPHHGVLGDGGQGQDVSDRRVRIAVVAGQEGERVRCLLGVLQV